MFDVKKEIKKENKFVLFCSLAVYIIIIIIIN